MTDEQIWSRYAKAALAGQLADPNASGTADQFANASVKFADAMLTAHRARFPAAEPTPVPMTWPEALEAMKQGKTVRDRDGDLAKMVDGAVCLKDYESGDWKHSVFYHPSHFTPAHQHAYWSGWTVSEAQDA